MEKFVITGGKKLFGDVTVSGGKNAAVAIIPAALLVNGVCRIENIPNISDVALQLKIIKNLGAKVHIINKSTMEIDCSRITSFEAPYELCKEMRASYYFIGALLGRFNKSSVAMPGGCDLGVRPIDQHIKGLEALGATVEVRNGLVNASAEKLIGANVYLDVVSVGATINIMIAAVLAEGLTMIENVAKEPHIVDLANFLNSMGANIKGAGTDVIKIQGVSHLKGGSYAIIPDQIEAGTYMVAAAATGGNVLVKNVIPKHLECISAKLTEMGISVEEYDDAVRVYRTGDIGKANIKTMPYPGFPTDMHPQMAVLMCLAEGTSIITEDIWPSRYRYVDELKRMGTDIRVEQKIAVIEGVRRLTGAPVKATDLRAGAALIIAGLCAEGNTEIEDIFHIDRGYENIVEKFISLGADLKRVEVPDQVIIEKAQ